MYIGRDCRYLAKQESYGLQNIEVEISDGQVQNDRPTLRSNFHMSDLAICNKQTVRSFVLPLLGVRDSHHDPEIIL